MAAVLDQKAYLKKYLSGRSSTDKSKKRKKKKKDKSDNKGKSRITIIDKDVDLKALPSHQDSDEEEYGDEVPIIAEIVDERPEHVKQREVYQSTHWKTVGDNGTKSNKEEMDDIAKRSHDTTSPLSSSQKENFGKNSSSPHSNKHFEQKKEIMREKQTSKTESGKEKHKRHKSPRMHGDLSGAEMNIKSRKESRKSRFHSDSDHSPLRYNRVEKSSPYHKIKPSNTDHSSPHSIKGHSLTKGRDEIKSAFSPKEKEHSKSQGHRRHDSDSDSSENEKMSPHSSKHNTDSDCSPPRTSRNVEKALNKNKKLRHDSSSSDNSLSKGKQSRVAASKHSSDSDLSPPRKNESSKSLSTSRSRHDSDSDRSQKSGENKISKNKQIKQESDSDLSLSPVRKRDSKSSSNVKTRHDSDSDLSPLRQQPNEDSLNKKLSSSSHSGSNRRHKSRNKKHNSDASPLDQKQPGQHRDSGSDLSPPRKRKLQSSDSDESPPRKAKKEQSDTRPSHTLSGLKAGIQDASNLRKETQAAKLREEEMLRKVGDELSGRNAETVVRDKETGQKRDLKEERRKQREEEEKQAEKDEKYMKWGKGLKQNEEQKDRIEQDLYEMTKPLARYQDDPDLEKHLREQEREGDPMLEFIRKKKKKHQGKGKGKKLYHGPLPPPNRFDIMPGYRWDGVDRSNGYERRLFEKKSSKQATEEEAYKWSVQNM